MFEGPTFLLRTYAGPFAVPDHPGLAGAGRSAAGAGRAAAAAATKAERENSAELKEMTFRPRICKKSAAIAKTMGRDGTKVSLSKVGTWLKRGCGVGAEIEGAFFLLKR